MPLSPVTPDNSDALPWKGKGRATHELAEKRAVARKSVSTM